MLNTLGSAWLAGVAAGFALAMPLGAVAVLLMREGLTYGMRAGAAAAAGVATTDTLYCVASMLVGTGAAPVILAHRPAFLVISGAVLIGIGALQLWSGRRSSPPSPSPASASGFLRFMAITAVNPLTLAYFSALSTVVSLHSSGWAAPAAFTVGVAVASLSWQLGLVAVGARLHALDRPGVVQSVRVIASLLVVVLGIAVLLSGVRG